MWFQCRRYQNRIRLDERTMSIASRSRPIDGQAARLARKADALGQIRPKATLIPIPKKIWNSYGIFPSGASTTQYGFRELEEHPEGRWMLRKWTESVSIVAVGRNDGSGVFSPGVFLLLIQRRPIVSSPTCGVNRPCPAAALRLGILLGLGLESPRLLLRIVEFDQRTGQRFL